MAKVYEISFKLGAQMAANFAKTMSSAGGALGQLNQNIQQLNNSQSSISSLVNLRRQVAESAKDYIAAKQRVSDLGRSISNTSDVTDKMRRDFELAKIEVSQAKDRLAAQRSELTRLNSQLGTTGQSTKALIERQKQMAASAEKARKAQASLASTMSKLEENQNRRADMRGQLFDAVGIAASMAAPIKLAADWEQSLAELNKVANKTPQQIQGIANAAQELAVKTGVAREGIIGAYTAAAQAGFPEAEWASFAETSAKMGVAFDTTGEKAGEMLKAWRSGMGMTMKDATMLAAATNHLANNMNATAMDIGEIMQRQGAVFKSAGLGSSQGAALSAALLSGGASPEIAATAGKNFVMALTKGAAATNGQKAALAALGFDDAAQLAKDMQVAPQQAIMQVLESVKGLAADEQTAIMTELFGSESIGAIAPLIANLGNLETAFKLVGDQANYAKSLEEEFAAMQSTTNNQAAKAKEGLKALGTAAGAVLLPAINSLLAAAAPLALAVAKFTQEFPLLTKVVVGAAVGLGVMKVASIAVGYAWTFVYGGAMQLMAVVKMLRVAWMLNTGAMVANAATSRTAIVVSKAMAAAQWLVNAAMTANPIGLLIVGITALIAIGVALYQNWDSISSFFVGAWQRMKDGAVAAWNGLKNMFTSGFNYVKELFLTFHPLGWMLGGFGRLENFLSTFSLHESGVKMLSTLADGIKAAVSYPIDAMKNALAAVREYLPFSDAKTGPLSELTASGAAIMSTLSDGMATANTADMMQPFSQTTGGMLNGSGSLTNQANRVAGSAGGAGVTIQVTQQISIGAGAGADVAEQARAGASAGADEMINKMRSALERQRRLSYA